MSSGAKHVLSVCTRALVPYCWMDLATSRTPTCIQSSTSILIKILNQCPLNTSFNKVRFLPFIFNLFSSL